MILITPNILTSAMYPAAVAGVALVVLFTVIAIGRYHRRKQRTKQLLVLAAFTVLALYLRHKETRCTTTSL